jgi:hypothetical protein
MCHESFKSYNDCGDVGPEPTFETAMDGIGNTEEDVVRFVRATLCKTEFKKPIR